MTEIAMHRIGVSDEMRARQSMRHQLASIYGYDVTGPVVSPIHRPGPSSVGPDGPAAILPENHFNLPSHTQSPSHILCIDVSHLSRRIHAFYSARENRWVIYATSVSALHLHKVPRKKEKKEKI